jgi:hypothetical protein
MIITIIIVIFMSVVIQGWPVVQMQFNAVVTSAEFADWLTQTSALMARQQPFTVVTSSDDQLILPEGYRKQEAIWYKQNKQLFGTYCKGLARIANSEAQFKLLDTPTMHKAWPCAYFVSLNFDDAVTWAEQQL